MFNLYVFSLFSWEASLKVYTPVPSNQCFPNQRLLMLLPGKADGQRREGENTACFKANSKSACTHTHTQNQYQEKKLRNHVQSQQELTLHNLRVNLVIEILIAHCILELLTYKKMLCWGRYVRLQVMLFAHQVYKI